MTSVYDPRSSFWSDTWAKADAYDAYLDASKAEHARRWRDMAAHVPSLSQFQLARLTGVKRELNVLMYSGVWCGDCVRQGPMLKAVADACGPTVRLRIIDREASKALQDELRICGGARVPVVVFLTEDFFEVGRFGDRLLAAYRAKAAREASGACATGLVAPPAEELAAELGDWIDVFERMLLMVRLSAHLRARHGD
ncbi:MAG: thiol reductase thioredoxin [Planctomycetes bacterium]|nr:thiol reductase thioredoxin [Planctomycetota bacterium]